MLIACCKQAQTHGWQAQGQGHWAHVWAPELVVDLLAHTLTQALQKA